MSKIVSRMTGINQTMDPYQILRDSIDAALGDGYVGIVAGAVIGGRTYVAGAGTGAADRAPDGRVIFRIASLSKVFTGTALAVAVQKGTIGLHEPAATYLPSWFGLPTFDGQPILIEHLATHTSGLPAGTTSVIEAGHSMAALAKSVAMTRLQSRPGSVYLYSNLGCAVLGNLLVLYGRQPYDALLRENVCGPLGLPDVVEHLNDEQRGRLAPGYDESGSQASPPTFPTGVASGGLYGCLDDLLAFAHAHLGHAPDSHAPALRLTTQCHFTDANGIRLGLFWHLSKALGSDVAIAWHDGMIHGYSSYLAIAPDAHIGVSILTNTSRTVDQLGGELLGALISRAEGW